jgi:hypothetical protein|tara:strand:- start:181 stop:1056 length:876 start_codon:yes stop_codon:yes gene_type:complete
MRLLLIIVLVALNVKLLACSGCNVSTGLVNSDPVNYLSLKYRNTIFNGVESSFFRHTGHGGVFSESYFNYDFSAKYFFYKKWYAQGMFSYQQVKLVSDSSTNFVNGVTDPFLFLGYNDFEIFKNWQLNYNVFGGLDFGIGSYKVAQGSEYSAGSKSYDRLLGVELLAKLKKVGFSLKGNIKFNSKNKENYLFGNVVNNSFVFLYYVEKENLMCIPFLGVTHEWNLKDKLDDDLILNTSSEVLFIDLGINFLFKNKFLIGGKYKLGFYNDVPGWESVNVSGFEIELAYIFSD